MTHEPRKRVGRVLFAIMLVGVLIEGIVGFFDPRAWAMLPPLLLFGTLGLWMWRAY